MPGSNRIEDNDEREDDYGQNRGKLGVPASQDLAFRAEDVEIIHGVQESPV